VWNQNIESVRVDALFSILKRVCVCALLTVCWVLMSSLMGFAMAESTGKVTATKLNIREQATTQSEALRCVVKGTKLTILDSTGDWYRVRYGKVEGYVAKEYVSAASSAKTDTKAASGAPKTSKPGDSNNSVLKLQQALTDKGYYKGRLSGNYGELTEKAVRAFQKAKGLESDGIAGASTIKALFGAAAAGTTYKTEKPNWFKGGQDLIPKDAVFSIKDVRSGRIFKVKRWSGGNHIDAEPYRAADTKAMKAAYGGRWSWDRRPILVLYNGHVYAASMNGMPHGNATIKDNGFDGVFCIHFYKSKTHETNRVDPQHQACVNEAAKAVW
jgi:hypothetical protein